MKKLTLILLGCGLVLLTANTYAQSGKAFKLRYKIYLNGNPKFPVRYSSKTFDKIGDATEVTYNSAGNIISTTKAVANTFVPDSAYDFSNYTSVTGTTRLFADIAQSDSKGQLIIHFWNLINIPSQTADEPSKPAAGNTIQLANQKLNADIAAGTFYINLASRQSLKISTAAYQIGPMILPFKVYLGSRDGVHTNNVTTAANVGMYIGTKWGSTSFNNLPAEKTATPHQKFWSVNFTAGASKIDIAAEDNINTATDKGSTLALTPGLAFGFHYDSFAIFTAFGKDLLTGKVAENWRYKNQVWLGFGIGFNIMN
jgi:hypothetical protein